MGNKSKDKQDVVAKCALCSKDAVLRLATIKCLGKDGWYEEDLLMCQPCIDVEKAIEKKIAKAA